MIVSQVSLTVEDQFNLLIDYKSRQIQKSCQDILGIEHI